MKHEFLDKYANLKNPVQALDVRIKFIFSLLFVFGVVLVPNDSFVVFGLLALTICGVIFFSKLPVKFIIKRSLVIVPFVVMVSIFLPFMKDDGTVIFRNILIKSYLSIVCLIVLTSTTKFADIMRAMESLKMPHIFTLILSFMYRYIFVIQDEFLKMKMAKESRTVRGSRWSSVRALANIVGVLFIRSYERGEAVYMAMCARGYDGAKSDGANPDGAKW